MSMNIVKLQAQLQHVPDQALINYVQNPQGEVPSYLALAELSRRKEIRKQAAPKQAAPTQTVAAQELAQVQPGVAALPLPEDMFQEKSMATGGIVAFADGGEVQHFANTGFVLSNPDYADPSYDYRMTKSYQDFLRRNNVSQTMVPYDEYVKQVKESKSTVAPLTDAEQINLKTLPKQNIKPLDYSPQKVIPVPPAPSSTADKTAVAPTAAYDKVTYTDIPFNQADYTALKEAPVTAQEKMAEWQNLVGQNEGLAALKDRLSKMEAKGVKEEEQAPWMALAKAGFAMAGGKSQHALSNIAEGAQAGLADYAAAKDKLNAAEEKRFGIQSQLAQAERSEKLAAAKYGVDSAEHIKAQNRATDLAALQAKSNIDVTNKSNRLKAEEANAKNAIDAQQVAVTAQHYRDWRDVMKDANQKSVATMDKAEKQQQTALLSAGLRDIDAQLKDPNLILDKNRMAELQRERAAINARLYELTGVKYVPSTLGGGNGTLTKPGAGGVRDYIPGAR